MGRTHVSPVGQPDDLSCGPSALKVALEILGKRKSLDYLYKLCKTNNNGVTTKHMIEAINKLGYPVEVVEYATLHHLQSALRYPSNAVRACIVSYLAEDRDEKPHPESGHWATVASFSASKSRIVLFDSSDGGIKSSYAWNDFRTRWMDYDLKRRKITKRGHKFHLVKKWQQQLLVVIAKDVKSLPTFHSETSEIFEPSN